MSDLKLPWYTNYRESDPETLIIEDANGNVVASICGQPEDIIGENIIRAVNSHAALVDALEDYGEHLATCEVGMFCEYDPARGWRYGYGDNSKWYKEPLPCTCGLDAALAAAKTEKGQ